MKVLRVTLPYWSTKKSKVEFYTELLRTSEPAFLLGLRFPFTVKSKALSYNPTNELRIYFITRYYISDEILTNEWNFAKRQLYEFQTVQLRETSNSDCQQSTTLIHMKPTAVTAPSTQLSGEVSYIFVSYSIGLFTSINLKRQS